MGALSSVPIPGRGSVIEPSSGSGNSGHCTVMVRAYIRSRNGKPQQVGAYTRDNPFCHAGDAGDLAAKDRRARARSAPPRQAAPAPAANVARAWEGQPNQAWREQIAATESGGEGNYGYGARNSGSSALGRYQLLRAPLIDAGWRDRLTNGWTQRAASEGVRSEAEFLANPRAQETALNESLQAYERQLRSKGAMRFVGQQLPGLQARDPVPVTLSGLVAAAHRHGAGGINRYINHQSAGLPEPASAEVRLMFRDIEHRLRAFAQTPYQSLR